MLKNLKKVIQKKVYDILSHKYGIFMVITAAVILIVAALHFGEVRKIIVFIRRCLHDTDSDVGVWDPIKNCC